MKCFFVSDLHGSEYRYSRLFEVLQDSPPEALFIGGDLLPNYTRDKLFITDYLYKNLKKLKKILGSNYPEIFVILGNDDLKTEEENLLFLESEELIQYINQKKSVSGGHDIYGYSYVPPSPFRLKDWEKYDVSRYTDIGCISPEEGFRSYEVHPLTIKFSTIKQDLDEMCPGSDLRDSIFLFHSPPYNTNLDIVSNKIRLVDYAPMDSNAGSIAIKNFIIDRQPLLTLHGHIHESTRNSSKWYDRIGRTYCFNAANDTAELSLIIFDTDNLDNAERLIL
jgi:Icc-related predicted phosphoesterase